MFRIRSALAARQSQGIALVASGIAALEATIDCAKRAEIIGEIEARAASAPAARDLVDAADFPTAPTLAAYADLLARYAGHVRSAHQPSAPAPPEAHAALPPRQAAVLACVERGLSRGEIETELGLSRSMVQKHVARLQAKHASGRVSLGGRPRPKAGGPQRRS